MKKISKEEYQKYLQSEHWKNVRERYFDSKLIKDCYICHSNQDLNLHHRTYKRLHAERLTDLVPLCSQCHKAVHLLIKNGGASLWESTRVLQTRLHARRGKTKVIKERVACFIRNQDKVKKLPPKPAWRNSSYARRSRGGLRNAGPSIFRNSRQRLRKCPKVNIFTKESIEDYRKRMSKVLS